MRRDFAETSQTHGIDWRLAGSIVLGGVFVLAAASKLWGIYTFEFAVDVILLSIGGRGQPWTEGVRQATIVATIGGEYAVGLGLLVLGRASRVPAMAATTMLVVFTGILSWLLAMESPPSCGCLGSLESMMQPRESLLLGITRNAVLIALAGWLSVDRRTARAPRHAPRAGFTLVEVLVVIAVIAVVIGLLVPAIGHIRKLARETAALSGLRQCGIALEQYTALDRGALPYLATPGKPEQVILSEYNLGVVNTPSYFRGQSTYWMTALQRVGLDLPELSAVTKTSQDRPALSAFYWLTHAAFARPEYWEGTQTPSKPELYAGVRMDEVTYPSGKGLLCDVSQFEADESVWGVWFGDGSASRMNLLDPPFSVPDLRRPYQALPWRVLTTPAGVRGRDY